MIWFRNVGWVHNIVNEVRPSILGGWLFIRSEANLSRCVAAMKCP
jgi:hypothetical protein